MSIKDWNWKTSMFANGFQQRYRDFEHFQNHQDFGYVNSNKMGLPDVQRCLCGPGKQSWRIDHMSNLRWQASENSTEAIEIAPDSCDVVHCACWHRGILSDALEFFVRNSF